MFYTFTANPSLDYLMQIPALQVGQTNRAQYEQLQPGGKGINVAILLHRLGIECRALGFVAGWTGQAILQQLQQQGLDCAFSALAEGFSRINVKVPGPLLTELNGHGPAIDAAAADDLLQKLDQMRAGHTLVLAGAAPDGGTLYRTMLQRLQGRGIRTVVDTAGTQLQLALPYRPFLIKPNLQELAGLFGMASLSLRQVCDCARQLQQQGAQNVLVSLGEGGALLLDQNGAIHRMQAARVTVKNSAGAGDAMVAGFLAALHRGEGFGAALRFATACAGATVQCSGMAAPEQIARIARRLDGGPDGEKSVVFR